MEEERNVSEKNEIFTEKLRLKGKSYYFAVRVASNGNKYLVITEGSWRNGQKKYNSVFVFDSNIDQFIESFTKSCDFMKSSTLEQEVTNNS